MPKRFHTTSAPRRVSAVAGLMLLVLLVASLVSACASPTTATTAPVTGAASATEAEATTTAAPTTVATVATTIDIGPATTTVEEPITPPDVTLTDVYDNRALRSGLKANWGFGCLVEGYESTILFDTGANGRILLPNMTALDIDPQDIDIVVLSHEHSDHTGGLITLLARNAELTVYCPATFSSSFTSTVERTGATVVRVDDPVSVCPGVTVMEPMDGGSIHESGLLLETAYGPVMLTGCAHPGIVEMVEAATTLAGRPLLAVLGGFHLYQKSDRQVDAVIASLKELGVRYCGCSHCTGDRAIAMFETAFGPDFINMAVGAMVQF